MTEPIPPPPAPAPVSTSSTELVAPTKPLGTYTSQNSKLLWGLILSMKALAKSIDPNPKNRSKSVLTPEEQVMNHSSDLNFFNNFEFKTHYFESQTGYRFLLTTDPSVTKQYGQDTLLYLYRMFNEYLIRNHLYEPGEEIHCPAFISGVDRTLRSLPFYQ